MAVASGGGILDTLSGPPGIPPISGGDAGPSDAYLSSGPIDLSSRFYSPFIFGGSGRGVNTAMTGYTTVVVWAVVGIIGFLLIRKLG